jgi:hypothetical protein
VSGESKTIFVVVLAWVMITRKNMNTDESDCIVVQKGGKGGGDVGSKTRGTGAGFERGEGESGVQSLRGEEEGT